MDCQWKIFIIVTKRLLLRLYKVKIIWKIFYVLEIDIKIDRIYLMKIGYSRVFTFAYNESILTIAYAYDYADSTYLNNNTYEVAYNHTKCLVSN